jgi:hypothetical protein
MTWGSEYIEEDRMPPGMADRIREMLAVPPGTKVRIDVNCYATPGHESMGCETESTYDITAWSVDKPAVTVEYDSFSAILHALTERGEASGGS